MKRGSFAWLSGGSWPPCCKEAGCLPTRRSMWEEIKASHKEPVLNRQPCKWATREHILQPQSSLQVIAPWPIIGCDLMKDPKSQPLSQASSRLLTRRNCKRSFIRTIVDKRSRSQDTHPCYLKLLGPGVSINDVSWLARWFDWCGFFF